MIAFRIQLNVKFEIIPGNNKNLCNLAAVNQHYLFK